MTSASNDLHDLLARVASGDLDPAEAARRLDEDPTAPTLDNVPVPARIGDAAVVITGVGVRLHVVADPSVATAVAEGPHRVSQDGDRLIFDLPGRARRPDGFEVTPRWQWGKMRIDWPYGSGERVTVRVNPALSLRLELTACDANVRSLRSALEVGCFSGSLTVVDHDGPLSGTLTTSSARIEAVLRDAADALSCDMSSLKLTLLPGSDTTLSAQSEMGSIKIAGPGTGSHRADSTGLRTGTEAVVGAGTGHLELAVRMGSAKVLLP